MYQYRLWGGRRLAGLLSAPLPEGEPIGEAWLLSDCEDHASVMADGPLKNRTPGQLENRRHLGMALGAPAFVHARSSVVQV